MHWPLGARCEVKNGPQGWHFPLVENVASGEPCPLGNLSAIRSPPRMNTHQCSEEQRVFTPWGITSPLGYDLQPTIKLSSAHVLGAYISGRGNCFRKIIIIRWIGLKVSN
jgi:hypothetical protein